MKIFRCDSCGQLIHFENTRCTRCDSTLGFLPGRFDQIALEPEGDNLYRSIPEPGRIFRFCANAAHGACNWLIDDREEHALCRACRFNRTIPDLSDPHRLECWRKLEGAKHRLIYGLMRLGLPLADKTEEPETGLAFDFLSDSAPADGESSKVLTGHSDGVITLNINEADDAERERIRAIMGEPYRTLLGHFRHEIGHYYWDRIVLNSPWLYQARSQFGDETQDYSDALKRHYDQGPPADWADHFVSSYASAHPWEDWAESWAHYLHMLSTLETAHAFGLRVRPRGDVEGTLTAKASFDPYDVDDFDALVDAWVPVTVAVNGLNRSMGQPDLYPFVMTEAVLTKLRLIHEIVRDQGRRHSSAMAQSGSEVDRFDPAQAVN